MLTQLTTREGTPKARPQTSTMSFGPRRGIYINAAERVAEEGEPLDAVALDHCDTFDLFYRTLCAAMYNYAPVSGHPGGSISCGRFVQRLLFETMDYDLASPNRQDADLISYAAGHKALGLYAMWALRNEIARIAAPELLPVEERFNSGSKICSASGATLPPRRRSSPNFAPKPSMGIPRRRLHSLGYQPGPPASDFRHRAVWPGPRPISMVMI
jgi:hypothetical protein